MAADVRQKRRSGCGGVGMDAKLAEAFATFEAGQTAQAEALYRDIARRRPNDIEALRMLGVLCSLAQRHEEALAQFDRALRVNRSQPGILYNRGISLLALARDAEALESFDRALKIGGPHADAYLSRAVALRRLQRQNEAVASCDLAIKLNPFGFGAHLNKANALADLGRFEEALVSYSESLRVKPSADAWMGRGVALKRLGRFEEALAALIKAREIQPLHPYLQGEILHLTMRIADWRKFERDCELVLRNVEQGLRAAHPGYLLSIPSTLKQQQMAAEQLARDKFAAAPVLPRPPRPATKKNITVGYFSSDFRSHAVSYLTAGLFEQHDKSEFTTIAFSYGGRPEDDYTRRIAAAVDRFVDVSTMSDPDVAALSRSLGIDIAIDLAGLTFDARLGIFAHRAAPVQATYLGYLGTTGCAFIDFVIADEVVLPREDTQFFTERPAYVSVSYQVNDSRRPAVQAPRNRADYGLPDQSFVFCCFNAGYKFTPDVFAIWMRLLRRVDHSVLWLLADSDAFTRNLRRFAEESGVAPDRLIFAKRVGLDEYFARQRCADLALDTFYYNGGVTTSDALWAGLPVVTRAGATFSARVAASLLQAIDLPDLVTHSSSEYEELAFRLATVPELLSTIRRRLDRNRTSASLFDTAACARRLEAAYRGMLGGQPAS